MAVKLQLKDNPDRYLVLAGNTLTLGKDEANDMVLDDSQVSDFHAELASSGETIAIEDLLSGSGTFVNGTRIHGKQTLKAWDVIRVGNVELEINDPSVSRQAQWHMQITKPDGSILRCALEGTTVIGRDVGCEIVLEHDLISRRHAELILGSNHIQVKDLNSVNGTLLNGRPISQALAYSGDEICIEPFKAMLIGPNPDTNPTVDGSANRTLMKGLDADEQPAPDESEPHTEFVDLSYRVACVVMSGSVSGGEKSKRRFPLLKHEYTLGRETDCDITLPDPSISKTHAKLQLLGGQWHILDLESSNGVLVNGLLVHQAPLQEGDRISLGREELVFGYEQQSSST